MALKFKGTIDTKRGYGFIVSKNHVNKEKILMLIFLIWSDIEEYAIKFKDSLLFHIMKTTTRLPAVYI